MMANKQEDFDYDDTEFVVGSDPSGMPPGLKDQDTEVEVEDDDELDLEIVDDTPKSDRGRQPLPKDVIEELEHEEAEDYSAKVKQRIDQLKKAWHDERRAKEAAARERDAAADYAKTLQMERDRFRTELSRGEGWAIEQAKERAKLTLENAKRAYRDAYESGDADAVAEAQQNLSRATYQFDQASVLSPRYAAQQAPLQNTQTPVYNQANSNQAPAQAPEPPPRAKDWGAKNPWFGKDKVMTATALGLHQQLVEDEGVPPDTDEYYERIDARMRAAFPDKFKSANKKRQPSTVVASAGRTPKGKKVVLTQSQVAIAKRLGVTPEAYAKELMKLESNNG